MSWLEPRLVGRRGQLQDLRPARGRLMTKNSPARHLSRITRNGMAELPNNAAWLLSKALKPVTSAAAGASSVAGGVSEAASSTAGAAGSAKSKVRQKARAAKRSAGG